LKRKYKKQSWCVWAVEAGKCMVFDIEEYFYPKNEALDAVEIFVKHLKNPREQFRVLVEGGNPSFYNKWDKWTVVCPKTFWEWHRGKTCQK